MNLTTRTERDANIMKYGGISLLVAFGIAEVLTIWYFLL